MWNNEFVSVLWNYRSASCSLLLSDLQIMIQIQDRYKKVYGSDRKYLQIISLIIHTSRLSLVLVRTFIFTNRKIKTVWNLLFQIVSQCTKVEDWLKFSMEILSETPLCMYMQVGACLHICWRLSIFGLIMVLEAGHRPVKQMKWRCSSQERSLHVEGSVPDMPPQWLVRAKVWFHWVKYIGSPDIQNQSFPKTDLPTLKELLGWKEE